jgi:hypothetical protein
MTMDHNRLVAALTKAGATITTSDHRADQFYATKGTRTVQWYTQEGFPNKERPAAVCVHWASPHTDAMTDCFCDTFYHTIKGAVASLDRATG